MNDKKIDNNKIVIKEYHSVEYLKKIAQGKKYIYILPNGKEIEVNGE